MYRLLLSEALQSAVLEKGIFEYFWGSFYDDVFTEITYVYDETKD